jgi:hypothetical protein
MGSNPEKTRVVLLKHRYGMTVEEYDELLKQQKGVCAICYGTNANGKRLAVDHNHETDETRGLLCANCNSAIGLLGDSVVYLASAIRYLNDESTYADVTIIEEGHEH